MAEWQSGRVAEGALTEREQRFVWEGRVCGLAMRSKETGVWLFSLVGWGWMDGDATNE